FFPYCMFIFHHTAITHTYTLSLHDALPIFGVPRRVQHGEEERQVEHPVGDVGADRLGRVQVDLAEQHGVVLAGQAVPLPVDVERDRKSTRLNSSHVKTSYADFCLKKKMDI